MPSFYFKKPILDLSNLLNSSESFSLYANITIPIPSRLVFKTESRIGLLTHFPKNVNRKKHVNKAKVLN